MYWLKPTKLPKALKNTAGMNRLKKLLQQDGAPSIYSPQVREALNAGFPNGRIGRSQSITWPLKKFNSYTTDSLSCRSPICEQHCTCCDTGLTLLYWQCSRTDCNNYRGISFLPTTYKILSNILLSRLIPYAEELLGIINVDFDAKGQLLIIYSVFVKYSCLRENGNTTKQCISSL